MYKKIFFLHFIFARSHISLIFAPAFKDAPTLGEVFANAKQNSYPPRRTGVQKLQGEVAQSVRAQDS